MKKTTLILVLSIICALQSFAQMKANFYRDNNGYVYFQLTCTEERVQYSITGHSTYNDHYDMWNCELKKGQSITVGPRNGFYWTDQSSVDVYWKYNFLSWKMITGKDSGTVKYTFNNRPTNGRNISFGSTEGEKYKGKKCGVSGCSCTYCNPMNWNPFQCSNCPHKCAEHN